MNNSIESRHRRCQASRALCLTTAIKKWVPDKSNLGTTCDSGASRASYVLLMGPRAARVHQPTKELVMNLTPFAKWTGTLLLLLTLNACGGSDDGGGGTAPQPVGTMIGAAGGTVIGPNERRS